MAGVIFFVPHEDEKRGQRINLVGGACPVKSIALRVGQRINLVGGLPSQEYSFVSLYMKNLMSVTPLNCVLKALIFALNDSADALVRRCSK